jgi:cell division protein ZapE
VSDPIPSPSSGGRPEVSLAEFQVAPRFADATFESYRPDPEFPSQQAAVRRLTEAIAELNGADERRGLLARLRRTAGEVSWQGLYLDGRFGVGKTHLLAAAYHSASVPRAYLSFQELTYAVGALGMARALDLFSQARLICLDEFELDDPGNTMLATSFVRGVIERGSRLIVTSNTLPGELGRGRFSAEEFQREIGALAASFESIRVDGEDYRHRHYDHEADLPRILPAEVIAHEWDALPWRVLTDRLAALPPLAYPTLIASFDTLAIAGLDTLPDQDTALRFVHFIDKAYDRSLPLVVSTECRLDELFPPSYGYGGFERKFLRCRSRLYEMLSHPLRHDRGVELEDTGSPFEEVQHAYRP